MQSANEEVSRDNPEMFFITAFAGILHLESGVLEYCNAGHDNPVAAQPAKAANAHGLRTAPGRRCARSSASRTAWASGACGRAK